MSSVTSDPVSFTLVKNLEAPVITVPANSATNVELTPTIAGTGRSRATVNVSDDSNTILTVSVNSNSTWSGVVTNPLIKSRIHHKCYSKPWYDNKFDQFKREFHGEIGVNYEY